MKHKHKIKIVYNACYGGFGLSRKATERLAQYGVELAQVALDKADSNIFGFRYNTDYDNIPRHDLLLVKVVEELGKEASASFANLQIHELRKNQYIIDEYDGYESVNEPDDINWIVV